MAKKKQKSVLLKVAVAVDEAGALSVNTNADAFVLDIKKYDAARELQTDGMIGSINIYSFEVPLMLPVTKKIKTPKVKKGKTIEPKQDAAEVNEPWKP